jgi:serine/threonine protein kinase
LVIVDHPELIAGRYRIDDELGRGGMGTVYAGHDLRLDRDVAVKVLRDDLASDPSFRRRFEREARAAARISHPNVVAVHDTGDDGARDTFIVMERLTGRTLGHELADGTLEEARLREVATAVLAALAAAHAEGIVHRDVKPGNILVAVDGTLKVGDFGIATNLDAGDSTTRVPMGTPAYTAPERLRGFAATGRSDLYSLGVVLYEAAAGARPFTGDGAVAVAEAVVDGDHRALAERRPDLPATFIAAVERALATDPADRFADADEMLVALTTPPTVPVGVTVPLRAPATETAVLPPPERSAPTPVAPVRRRRFRPALVAMLVGIVLVLAIAIGLLISQGDDTAAPPESTTPTTVSAPVAGPPLPTPLADALDRLQEATQP